MAEQLTSGELPSSGSSYSTAQSASEMTVPTSQSAIVVFGNSAITPSILTPGERQATSGSDTTQRQILEHYSTPVLPPIIHTDQPPRTPSASDECFDTENEDGPLVSQCTDDTPCELNITKLLDANPDKIMIAFLCVSTGDPKSEDHIENCTAMERLKYCFKTQLGYLTIPLGENVTTAQLDELMFQVRGLRNTFPRRFCRVLFYFFGHGNETSIQLADGSRERDDIISNFQSLCPPKSDCPAESDCPDESDIFKIFIFDCCRLVNEVTCIAEQESHHDELKALAAGVDPPLTVKKPYPASTNTLVINATDQNCRAYYKVSNGCGLMTHFLTKLAPTLNDSLHGLLVAIRKEIITVRSSGQMVVYDDKLMGQCNLLAESHGTARVMPQDVQIGLSASVLSTNICFKFDDKVEPRIKYFLLEISSGSSVYKTKHISPPDRMEEITGLAPGTSYHARVIAVYDDQHKSSSKDVPFTTRALEVAHISSVSLKQLSPLKLQVNWEAVEGNPEPSHYTVSANGSVIYPECRSDSPGGHSLCAKLSLQLETEYLLKVITHYKIDGNLYSRESVGYSYTTPSENDIKPTIVSSQVKRNSVTVTVTDPPIFQPQSGLSADGIQLENTYELSCTPDEGNSPLEFRIERESGSIHHQGTISGIIPGCGYRVECKIRTTSNLEDLCKGETTFTATNPHCIQRVFSSPYCIPLIIGLFFFCVVLSYVPYSVHLRARADGVTSGVFSNEVIDCGGGNSFKYSGISIAGSPEKGDDFQGDFTTWLIPRQDLKLHSRKREPFPYGYPLVDGRHYVQLLGWSEYLWEGSVISGHCCVENLQTNGTNKNADLFIFTNDEDKNRYESGEPPENYVFSDTLTVPPGTEHCFTKWGGNKTFTVSVNAYHYFILHVSADGMNFSSKIWHEQRYVNSSDLTDSRSLTYNGHTFYHYPTTYTPGSGTDYIALCQTTSSFLTRGTTLLTTVSLHIRSWGNPRWNTLFDVILGLGISGFLLAIFIFFVVLWYIQGSLKSICEHMRSQCHSCPQRNINRPLERLNSQELENVPLIPD